MKRFGSSTRRWPGLPFANRTGGSHGTAAPVPAQQFVRMYEVWQVEDNVSRYCIVSATSAASLSLPPAVNIWLEPQNGALTDCCKCQESVNNLDYI